MAAGPLTSVVAVLGLGFLFGANAQASTVKAGFLTMARGRSVISQYEGKAASVAEAFGDIVDWSITGCWRIGPTRVNCAVRVNQTSAEGVRIRCTATDTAWLVHTTIHATGVKRPCVRLP
jgi:hypothetical protein